MVFLSFLNARSLATVETALQRAWVTLIEFYEPPEITTMRRIGGVWTEIASFTPVRIRPIANSSLPTGSTEAASEIANSGSMRIYSTVDIKRDDRFKIGDDKFDVGLVEAPDNHGTQIVNFTMVEG